MAKTKYCKFCGKKIEGRNGRAKFCSDKCRYAYHHRNKRFTYTCDYCGEEFQTADGRQDKFCSRECYYSWAQEHREQVEIVCDYCGKTAKVDVLYRIPNYCSEKCQNDSYRERNPEKIKQWARINSRKRRALKYDNGEVESIDKEEVFENDDWICCICGKPVDPTLDYPHPMSASLEHLTPLANGGTHTWDNVGLAHLRCNQIRHTSRNYLIKTLDDCKAGLQSSIR